MHHRMHRAARIRLVTGLLCCCSTVALAQEPAPPQDDSRMQYPVGLANSFVAVSAGSINYAFSQEQLEPGHQAESIEVPHTAARVVLFGHHFGKYFSVQGAYMRPVKYVRYRNLNGSADTHTVWMHFGTVTAHARMPVSDRVSLFGEGGGQAVLACAPEEAETLTGVPLQRIGTVGGATLRGLPVAALREAWET
jgi:hypothetical protein